jgi:transaldolase
MMNDNNRLRRVQALGQSIWLDDIHRGMLNNGDFQRYIDEDGITGVTSNPAILKKAILGHDDYDAPVAQLAADGLDAKSIYEQLVISDLQQAADLLRPGYDESEGRDGFVSMEVNPHLAHDTEQTIAAARRLWGMLDRPNIMIKVPATREGIPAIRSLIAQGINVNATLLFSVSRYRDVIQAYNDGIEERMEAGLPVETIASVASFFLSRIDVLVDRLLAEKGNNEQLHGKAAIASARRAYQVYMSKVTSEQWRKLSSKGAGPQRLLWASTSTKNEAYSDVMYVDALIGDDTVNTLPLKTLDAYRDHGDPAARIADNLDQSDAIINELNSLGIDMEEVAEQLEKEGVDKFIKPFDELLSTLDAEIKTSG